MIAIFSPDPKVAARAIHRAGRRFDLRSRALVIMAAQKMRRDGRPNDPPPTCMRMQGQRLLLTWASSNLGDAVYWHSVLFNAWLDVGQPHVLRSGRVGFYVTRNPLPESYLIGHLAHVLQGAFVRTGRRDSIIIRRQGGGQIFIHGNDPHYTAIVSSYESAEFQGSLYEVYENALDFARGLEQRYE